MTAMKIALGALSRYGIESELGSGLGDAAQAALSHYCGKVEAGRPPAAPPGFLKGYEPSEGATVVEPVVDSKTEEILESQAQALGVDLDRLAAHAVMTYLAELDFLSAPGSTA
jgi:hypothetical protein